MAKKIHWVRDFYNDKKTACGKSMNHTGWHTNYEKVNPARRCRKCQKAYEKEKK